MEIVLLGTVGARAGGAEVDVGVRKHRFVLALLALEANSAVATDRIVDVVWRDGPPRSARRMVHGIVSGLRSALTRHAGEDVRLVSEGDGYALRCDPLRVDAHRFRALLQRARTTDDDARRVVALDEALALWRGPALAGIATNEVRDGLSSGLEEARLGAVEDRLDARRRLGLPAAVDELLDLHRAHPHRPRLVEHLMLALHRAGRTPEALEVYRRTRTSLAHEHGLDVSGDLERLHLAILRGETAQPPTPAVAVSGPVPAQLPADPSGLIGRDGEVSALVRTTSAARGELVVCAVDGMAGVGKTALSVRAAHHLAPRFPDGQLFLDLHGFTPGRAPVAPLDALRHLLGSFGVPDVPGDLDSAAARWRSLVAGRRVLLVLDNASSDAQVVPLLPGGPGCAVVLTSRQRLTAGGHAVPLSLGPLTAAASDEVFRSAAGLPVTSPVGEVTALCGGLPLALRTAANRLRNRPLWTVEDLAALLSDPAHLVAELRLLHAFDSSLVVLDDHSRQAFSLLARCAPARFGAADAAALLDVPPRRAHRLLEELVDLHLLVAGPQGYSFHELVRLHAAS